MDHQFEYSTAYWRSQNDPTVSFEPPADGMVRTASQESDPSGYADQPSTNAYPYDDGYRDSFTRGGRGNTDYGWSGSYSTQDNYTTDAPFANTVEMGYYPTVSSESSELSGATELAAAQVAQDPGSSRSSGAEISIFHCQEPNCEQMPFSRAADLDRHKRMVHSTKPGPESSSQATKMRKFHCLETNCKQKPFRRAADLERHYKMVHSPGQAFLCDYRRCPRAENSFHRQDHFREHLRDFHKEDLLRRGSRNSDDWWTSRSTLGYPWWLCNKCLQRVEIDTIGWICSSCKSHCETERQRWRMRTIMKSA